MPRKTVVVVKKPLVRSTRVRRRGGGQLGSGMPVWMLTLWNPNKLSTQVVSPLWNVHVDPDGGVIGGSAEAEAGKPTATTAAAAIAAQNALFMRDPLRSLFRSTHRHRVHQWLATNLVTRVLERLDQAAARESSAAALR
jgi:hypothetical protein